MGKKKLPFSFAFEPDRDVVVLNHEGKKLTSRARANQLRLVEKMEKSPCILNNVIELLHQYLNCSASKLLVS